MSALTERVAREHQYSPGFGGCECGLSYERDASTYYGEWHLHAEHVAEVTERAVRANVAVEIRARIVSPEDTVAGGLIGASLERAATIAEGKKP